MYEIRLATIAGLDISNAQHSVAIDEALMGIEDKEAFLEYCRDKKEGIQYATKPEKLDTLATKYKNMQDQAKLPYDIAGSFSRNLVSKVEKARTFIKNTLEEGIDRPFSRLIVDGEKYFSSKELNALSELNISPEAIIALSENSTLKDELVKLFLSKYTAKKKYEQIGTNQKRVHGLIQNTAKGIK